MYSIKQKPMDDVLLQMPVISVYMPTHNRCLLLKRAINSVLTQTYQDFELIIVDDGSSDGTAEYLEEIAIREPKIVVLRNEVPQGACVARNRAIRAAKGEFVTGIDDDDEFLPHRLQLLLEAYTKEYAFVTSAQFWDYGKTRKLRGGSRSTITESMILSHNFATNQVFAKKQDLIDVELFDESMSSCQDWDIWTRLVIEKGSGLRIAEPLYVIHTVHEYGRISTSEKWLQGFNRYYEKHQERMNRSKKKDFKLRIMRKRGDKITLQDVIKLCTRYNAKRLLEHYAKSLFPRLANKRIKRLTE